MYVSLAGDEAPDARCGGSSYGVGGLGGVGGASSARGDGIVG